MTLNKCKKKTKWIICITGQLTEQQRRQFDNHRGLQSFQFSVKNHLFSLYSAHQVKIIQNLWKFEGNIYNFEIAKKIEFQKYYCTWNKSRMKIGSIISVVSLLVICTYFFYCGWLDLFCKSFLLGCADEF